MKKKRRVFDIDFEADVDVEQTTAPSDETSEARRGPMAAAITENAGALDARAEAEAAIRAENDALAHEHVRLKKLGLITDLVPIELVHTSKLKRDRLLPLDNQVDELKTSIREIGLSNPILVERTETGYELIQGLRRLTAFRGLAEEDPKYANIPASMVPMGESVDTLYRKMVDENLIRQDVSFAEMAMLASDFAKDQSVGIAEAVDNLFASAGRQKRAYIKNFARLLTGFQIPLNFPQAMPRALGLDLLKYCESDQGADAKVAARLNANPDRTSSEEIAILRAVLSDKKTVKTVKRPTAPVQGKTTLRFSRADGAVKCLASQGRIELQQDRDFGAVDRQKLERALEAFFQALDQD